MDATGRPRLYPKHKPFNDAVEGYFALCKEGQQRPTLSGLSYHLGFEDRETFSNYAGYGDEFSRTVKRAKLQIADWLEQRLTNKETFTPGIIFDLKNNHGWRDATQSELSGPNGGPIRTDSRLDVGSLTDDQLRALASIPVQRG
jgi:hypothetical protein